MLRQDGHRVSLLRPASGWRDVERQCGPDVVIAAVATPEAVLEPRSGPPRGFPAPFLFVAQESDVRRDTILDERIVDRIESPFMAEDLLARVDALVRVRQVVRREWVEKEAAESRSAIAPSRGLRALGARIATLLWTRVPRFPKPSGPYLEVAARVAEWADRHDGFEPGHAERVANFSAMIADGLGMQDGDTAALLRAAMLHDIGKVALPAEILRRQGPLGEDQMRLVRTHADRGARLLRALDDDGVVADAILHHHERVDGLGYHGLRGDDIPLAARILAVAEAYDAMTATRVRTPMTSERAIATLRDKRGANFAGDCVDALVDALRPAVKMIPLSRA